MVTGFGYADSISSKTFSVVSITCPKELSSTDTKKYTTVNQFLFADRL